MNQKKIKVINPEENQTEIVHICISNSQIEYV